MEIGAAWDIIDRVLHDKAPVVQATLRGPVADADLDRLEHTVGRSLPADFVESLRLHDGQDDPTRLLALCDHHVLLSVAAMIETSDMRADALGDDPDDVYEWMTPVKVRAAANVRGWLPFTEAEGDNLALDLDPLPAGEIGQVLLLPFDGPTPEPEHASFGAWLGDLASRLDAGAFRVDERLGIWLER